VRKSAEENARSGDDRSLASLRPLIVGPFGGSPCTALGSRVAPLALETAARAAGTAGQGVGVVEQPIEEGGDGGGGAE
jgi:hypothetical protein